MSKYKYSSQLSTQYRNLFQSYHSLDRYENELKKNQRYSTINHQNQQKSSQYAYNYNRSNSLKKYNHNIDKQYSSLNRNKQFSLVNNQPKTCSKLNYNNYTSQTINRTDFQYKQRNKTTYSLGLTSSNQNNQSYQHYKTDYYSKSPNNIPYNYLSTLSKQQFHYEPQQKINRRTLVSNNDIQYQNKYFQQKPTISYNEKFKNEYKMKINDINKKRNQLKLKIRLQDNQKISQKYSDQFSQEILPNKYNYQTIQSKRENLKSEISNKLNLKTQAYDNRKQPRKVLGEHNYQALKVKTQNNDEKYFIRSRQELSNYKKQDQFIRTPHFYSDQNVPPTKNIKNKLDGIVRHTFTDRI